MRALFLAAMLFAPASQAAPISLEFSGSLHVPTDAWDPLGITGLQVGGSAPLTGIITFDTSKLEDVTFPYYPGFFSVSAEGTNWITSAYFTVGDLVIGLSDTPQHQTLIAYDNAGQVEGGILGMVLAPVAGYGTMGLTFGDTRFCGAVVDNRCIPIQAHIDPLDPVTAFLSGDLREYTGRLGNLGFFEGTWTQVSEPGTLPMMLGALALGALYGRRRLNRQLPIRNESGCC